MIKVCCIDREGEWNPAVLLDFMHSQISASEEGKLTIEVDIVDLGAFLPKMSGLASKLFL